MDTDELLLCHLLHVLYRFIDSIVCKTCLLSLANCIHFLSDGSAKYYASNNLDIMALT